VSTEREREREREREIERAMRRDVQVYLDLRVDKKRIERYMLLSKDRR